MDNTISDRIRLRFNLFDTDHNGVLEPADFVALADRIIQAVGAAETDPKAKALRAAHDQYWQSLRAGNAAGRIDLAAYAGRVSATGWFDQHGRPYAEALADICDRDDDGLIGLTEFQTVLVAAGFAAEKVRRLFASFDQNGDGSIDRDEWISGIEEFYDPRVSETVTDVLVDA